MKRAIQAAILIALTSLGLAGQKPPGEEIILQELPVNPLETLIAIASDSSGNPVTDLRPAEIQIFDNDSEQKIASLHAYTSTARLMTIIVFDQLNMGESAQVINASSLIRFLRSESPKELANLYLHLIDLQGHLIAVRSVPEAEGEANPTANLIPLFQHDLNQIRAEPGDLANNGARRYNATVEALQGVIWPLIGRSELKNIVWITAGIPIINWKPEARKLAADINQVNSPLYIVNEAPPDWITATKGFIQDCTDMTGGRALINSKLQMVIQKARTDLRNAYEIAYEPPLSNWDDSYHTIRMACSRPGVTIRCKQVYLARKPF